MGFARRATDVTPTDANVWNTLGVALYVSGEWKDARDALSRSVELSDGGIPEDWLFLAPTHHKLGDSELASEWYDRAQAKIESFGPELTRFATEAEDALGGIANGVVCGVSRLVELGL